MNHGKLIMAGGPAFPSVYTFAAGSYRPDGTKVPEERAEQNIHIGLTVRDYFAAAALQGLATDVTETLFYEMSEGIESGSRYAKVAYAFADAMLAERDK